MRGKNTPIFFTKKYLQILCKGLDCIEAFLFSLGDDEDDKGSDNDIPGK